MLEDSGARVLLIDNEQWAINTEHTIETINLREEGLNHGNESNLDNINLSNNLVYVIYTSGSTGKPKGVMIEHRNLGNFIGGITERIDFNPDKAILSLTTISFDIFALETLLPLTVGMRVIIAGRDEQMDPAALNILLTQVEMLQTTPSRMQMLINSDSAFKGLKHLKEIMLGGEALPGKLLHEIQNITKAKIYNLYGPTETTVWSTLRELTNVEYIDIGKPIANTQIYIVDKFNNPVPIGVTGELCIGGDGLARGYLNKPELTTEKFVSNPFRGGADDVEAAPPVEGTPPTEGIHETPLHQIYRTGDLARWRLDGNIEFLGRIDHQVKIRGYRIELGEIEARLLGVEGVKEAVVIARESTIGENYLVAYIVAQHKLAVNEIRDHLSKALPSYMIPSYFIYLDKAPLTPNGKINRKALPEPDGSMMVSREYAAPRNQTEERLCGIWKEILSIDSVGITDNFFELGGHSLKATTLVSRIHKEMDVQVPLGEVFKAPTVKEMGEYIRGTEKSIYEEIKPVEKREYYSLSSAQKRLYILNRIDGPNISYNLPAIMKVSGKLDREKLEKAYNKIIRRHETLRTSFHMVGEEPVQRIHEDIRAEILFMKSGEAEIDSIAEKFIKPFELDKAPLMRLAVVKIDECKSVLLFDMNHIISDGTSISILIKEFVSLYNEHNLAPLKIQYKDYSQWQSKLFDSGSIKKQEEYWLNRFQGEIPILNMPTDYPRPAMQNFEGSSIKFSVNGQIVEDLKRICRETGSTIYMALLAVYNTLLYKYTGQEDII